MTDLDAVDGDGAMARHLARTLHEVATTTPIPDRRDAIADRLDRRPRRRRTVTALAVAAVVLVVVALATVAIRRGDDGAVDLRPAEDPRGDTGWYLPGDGWTVTAATTRRLFEGAGVCPCTTISLSETGADPAAVTIFEGSADPDEPPVAGDGAEAIDVGGRSGTVRRTSVDGELPAGTEIVDPVQYVVHAGGRQLYARSNGVDDAAVVALLDAWADRVEADEPVRREDLPVPEGMEASIPQTKRWTFDHEVLVDARNDTTGEVLSYQLVPQGGSVFLEAVLDSEGTTFEDDVFTVRSRNGPDDLLAITHVGGPVDIVAGVLTLGGTPVDDDVVEGFDAALHPVDTATWRAAIGGLALAVDDPLLTAPTLTSPPLTG